MYTKTGATTPAEEKNIGDALNVSINETADNISKTIKINTTGEASGSAWQTKYTGTAKTYQITIGNKPIGNGGGRDQFGVKMIQATKVGGIEIFMPDNLTANEQDIGDYHQNINRKRGIGGEDTRSNDMHFTKGILNVEATGYFKFIDDMDDCDVKLRGGKHGDPKPKSARCYIFRFNEQSFGKEFPHDKGDGYSWHPGDDDGTEAGKPFKEFDLTEQIIESHRGKWVGLKGITFNEGNDKVHCEMWLDFDGIDSNGQFDPERQNWKRLYSIVDEDGKYGKDDNKHQTSKAWTTLQENSTIQFRVDAVKGNMQMEYKFKGPDATFKNLSVREINAI